MARTPSETMTGREAQVMDAVWRLGEATAEQVREALAGNRCTIRRCGRCLRVLESKGYLGHEARGKTYVYRAVDRAAKGAAAVSCAACWRGSSADRPRTWFSG